MSEERKKEWYWVKWSNHDSYEPALFIAELGWRSRYSSNFDKRSPAVIGPRIEPPEESDGQA